MRGNRLIRLLLTADHRLLAVDIGIAIHLNLKLDPRVIVCELDGADRQMRGIVGIARDLR